MAEQYIVSARKYRPQTFETVVGQSHITTTLKNAVRTGHIAHAYLFCGPRGVGKTTCARILARTINCEHPTEEMEACGACTTCLSFKDNAAFNIFELDAASNNSVDDIRALTEQVRYAPQIGKYKIYIIDEVHMLSAAAFNAFLKTLEEPPPYAIFILATTEKHKILPTILSRCQIFDFKRIGTQDIVAHLESICKKENTVAENTALHIIAQKSEGCMRDALSMMDRIASFTNGLITYSQTVEHLNILDADTYFTITDHLLAKDIAATLLQLDTIFQKGFEGNIIINGFTEHFRNLLLCQDKDMAKILDVAEDHKRIYFSKSQIIPTSYILSAINILNDAEIKYKEALNKRMHTELCMMKLCYLNDVININSDEFKKKIVESKNSNIDSINSNEVKEATEPYQPELQHTSPTIPIQQDVATITENTPKPAEELKPKIDPEPKEIPEEKIGKKRLGKDLYNSLLQQQNEQQTNVHKIDVTPGLIDKLFKEYIASSKAEELLTLVAQLEQMNISFIAPEEIHIKCSSSINYHFALNQRDKLLDYFILHTHDKNLRITLQIDENATVSLPENTIKSKEEIFEEMSKINPALNELRDALNLRIS